MMRGGRVGLWLLATGAMLSFRPDPIRAQTAAAMQPATPDSAPRRDGQRDFDFLLGNWKFHLKRLLHPLTGSTTWVTLDGSSSCRKIWDGNANLDELVVDNVEQHLHIQGLTLRLYNPATREWSLYWGTAANGFLSMPPTVGHFTNGRGEFYDQEDYNGRPILVRYLWSDITATSAHFEQSFSADWGKTWETNWITDQTRVTS